MLGLYSAWYNFSRVHSTIKTTPAVGKRIDRSCLEHRRTADGGGVKALLPMATVDELLFPFAQSIHVKAKAFNTLRPTLTASQSARMLEAISDDIKKCTNFVTPVASRAALEEAARMKVDICSKHWHDQPKFDRGRKTFHWEHVVPVSAIRAACLEADSESAVFEILRTRARVAWILKAEDSKLTRLGFRHKRDEPDAAYLQAKIELVKLAAMQEPPATHC